MKPTLKALKPGNLDPLHHGIGLVVDCETTGGSPEKHGVVELALIQFAFQRTSGQILGTLRNFEALVDPGPGPRNPIAMRIHGIPEAEFRGRRLDLRKVRSVRQGVEFVVAHNARFDASFLTPLIPSLLDLPWLCSLHDIPWREFGFESRALSHLTQVHGVAQEVAHRAGSDARATLELLSRPSPAGPTYLGLLLAGGARAA